jgi:hypothetical protein
MKVSCHSRGFVARPSYVKVSENGLHTSNFTDLETIGYDAHHAVQKIAGIAWCF